MKISLDDPKFGISSDDDWKTINTRRLPGFSTYKGLYFGILTHKIGKLTKISIKGRNLPNFDLQVTADNNNWSSLFEGNFIDIDMKKYVHNFEDILIPYEGYRIFINSRDAWIVDSCELHFIGSK